ncbi:MAG: Prochlorococcus phage [Pseudomonadota bacterium]|jgi:hypothetical protein
MSQHDYVLADAAGAAFLADLNSNLAAIVSQNSGATEPSTTYAYQFWADTTTGLLKIRNAANSAWISVLTLATGLPIGRAASGVNADITSMTAITALGFPATQVPSVNANTLDDYEEGTWTPAASFSTSNGNLSQNTQVGTYTKIGRMVCCQFYLAFGETTASGNLSIIGLPFAASATATTYNRFGISIDNMTGLSGGYVGAIDPSSTTLVPYQNVTGSLTVITATNTGNPSQISGNFFYFV